MDKNKFAAYESYLNSANFLPAINFLNDVKRRVGPVRYRQFLDLLNDIGHQRIDSLDKREAVKKVRDMIGNHEDLMRTFFELAPSLNDASDVKKRELAKEDPSCNGVKGEPSGNEPGQEAREIDDSRSDLNPLQKAVGVFRKLIDILETILNNKRGDSKKNIEAEVNRLVEEVRLVTEKDFYEHSRAKTNFGSICSDVVKAVGVVVQIVEKEFPNTNSKASSELNVVGEDIQRAEVHRLAEEVVRHLTDKYSFKDSCANKD